MSLFFKFINACVLLCFLRNVIYSTCATIQDDAKKTVPQLLTRYGYKNEEHFVTTEDGYILALHRIPNRRFDGNETNKKVPVLITHGLLGSSSQFVILGPDKALGYLLADADYDVWLMNCRGSSYSTNHTTLSPYGSTRREFWNFSFHEMGVYDIPACIDYIIKITKENQLLHIGHSQGTKAFFIMLSEKPKYNSRILAHFSYAPTVFQCHITHRSLRLIAQLQRIGITNSLRSLLGDFNVTPESPIFAILGAIACPDGAVFQPICRNAMYLIYDYTMAQMNTTLLPIIAGHNPAGASVKQFDHTSQIINSCKFRPYQTSADYIPKEYNFENMKVPVYVFYGQNDTFVTPKDISILKNRLPNGFTETVYIKNWGHIDFVFGNDARELVYIPTIQYMSRILNNEIFCNKHFK